MKRQVVVVGAGPGGSSAAYHLAKKGLDVLLVDKENFPREKICGDAYQSSLFPIFKDMGIYEEMEANIQAQVKIIRQIGPGEEDVEYKVEHAEWLIPRRIGDDIIRRAALKAGSDWLEGFEGTELIMKRGQVKGVKGIYNNRDMEIEADITVIANGSHSMLGRQIGIFNNDPGLYMFAIRGNWEGVEGLKPGTSCWIYDGDFMPVVDQELCDKHYYQPMWIGGINEECTQASVGCCVSEGLLRGHGMAIDEYFEYWRTHSKAGKVILSHAHCVDGMKGWRLPCSNKIEKNYAAGAMVVGDAASAPDPCYYYGISPAMYGGKFCADIAEEAFAENDFSEEKFSVFHQRLGAMYDPIWAQYVSIRKNIVAKREVARNLIKYALAKPEYPNIFFGATFSEYMQKVLKENASMSYGNQLEGH
jgi:flavin-dependent dehydrogenase